MTFRIIDLHHCGSLRLRQITDEDALTIENHVVRSARLTVPMQGKEVVKLLLSSSFFGP